MTRKPTRSTNEPGAPAKGAKSSTKQRKRSPGRPSIPLDRIIDAAIEIIDTQGADALSMRSVAQHLDSGTATLYRHFSGRTELVGLVVDRIMSEAVHEMSDGGKADDWQSVVASTGRSIYALLNRHKGIAALLVDTMPDGPNAMILRDRLTGLLLANGFSPEIAAKAYATISRFVLGFAIQSRADESARDTNLSGVVDRESYPALYAVADHLPVDLDDEFEFGLNLILAGLARHGKGTKS